MQFKKICIVLLGVSIITGVSGCMMFEEGKSVLYVPGAKDSKVSHEIDYMSMNLLNSDRAINIDMYGRPNTYKEKVVFLANVGKDPLEDFNYDIFVAQPDGTKQRRLTFTSGVNELQPRWTKSGKIIYAVIPGGQSAPEYYLMNADGTERTVIDKERYQKLRTFK